MIWKQCAELMGAGLMAVALAAVIAALPPARAAAQDAPASDQRPRMAALKAGEVNARAGPGVVYPIKWVYTRARMPVEVIGAYGAWRRVRDWEGAEAWIHATLLTDRRHALVTAAPSAPLRQRAAAGAPAAAHLGTGVVAAIESCGPAWCRLSVGGEYRGWAARADLWGLYPGETLE